MTISWNHLLHVLTGNSFSESFEVENYTLEIKDKDKDPYFYGEITGENIGLIFSYVENEKNVSIWTSWHPRIFFCEFELEEDKVLKVFSKKIDSIDFYTSIYEEKKVKPEIVDVSTFLDSKYKIKLFSEEAKREIYKND